MFERYVDFTTRFNPEHIKIEETIVSQAIGVGGTIDRVSVINGKRFLIDIKQAKAFITITGCSLPLTVRCLMSLLMLSPPFGPMRKQER